MTKQRVRKMGGLKDSIEEIDKLLLPGGDLELAEEKVEMVLKALSSSHSQIEVARVYIQAAQVKVELGKYKETESYGLRALDLLRDTAEHRLRGKAQWCLGRAYFYLGKIDKSRMFFEDSLSTYRTIGDEQGKLDAVNGLTLIDFAASDWLSAKKRLKYAYQINQESGNRRGMALCLTNLATVSILLGEHNAAEKALKESIKIKEELGDLLLLTHSWISLSRLYLRERRWSEASGLIQKAREVSEGHTLSRQLAMSLESEGQLYFERKEYAKAEKSYLKALKIGERISPEGDIVSEVSRKLADLYVAIKEFDKAVKYGQRALEVSTKLGDRFEQGCCHRALAVAYHLKGLRDRSQEEFAKAISILRSIGDRFELAHTLLAQGELRGELELLQEAQRLFAQIQGAEFYQALALLQIAKAEPSCKVAVEYLREAEKILRAKGEGEKLKEVESLKVELNRKLIQPTTEKYKVLKGLASPGVGDIFEGLVRELEADQGFIAYRSRGEMVIGRTHNLAQEEASKVLSLLSDENGFQAGEPFILYDTALDDRFSSLGAGSVMITSFTSGGNGEAGGYLYLARLREREPFLEKEYDLFYTLSHLAEKAISEQRQRELEEELVSLKRGSKIITHSPKMLRVMEVIELAKNTDATILLMGETGTGKDFLARKIHQGSHRGDKSFVEIHCGPMPKELVESELFGHERGAFTGAISRKLGRLELAAGGTLFLNEIGELPESTQVKLLRFLDTNELERLGGNETIKVDTRVIAATNRDLKAEVDRGRFRKDLYYRLNMFSVELPPLREREEDIPLLAQHFLKLYGDKHEKKIQGMAPEVLRALMEYDWPGNIRELEHVIEVMVIAARDGEEIGSELLPNALLKSFPPGGSCTLPGKLASIEKEAICDALKRTKGIKTRAAQILGIHEATLRSKMKKYKIEGVMDN